MLVKLDEIDDLPSEEVIVMATGSQGEPMAVLNRLATGTHRQLSIQDGDTVLLSSHTIPGNEESANNLINRLFQRGADVHYGPMAQAHVSGHGSQEELKVLIDTLKPEFFIPVHGELRMLVQHAKLAHEMGVPKSNIAVVENGYPVNLAAGQMSIGQRVPGEYVFVDGKLVGEVGPTVMTQRDALAQSGFVTVVANYNRKKGKIKGEPRILTQGFVYVPDAGDLLDRAADVVRSVGKTGGDIPLSKIEEKIERSLVGFFSRETRRKPVVTVALVEA
jgi:ribonuclease J